MTSNDSFYIVHPLLHTSGFGNQAGMLLQHVALARLSRRTLVLPPLHQPPEHQSEGASSSALLNIDEALNLTALSTECARVISLSEFQQLAPPTVRLEQSPLDGSGSHLTFSTLVAEPGPARPLRLEPAPAPMTLAALRLLEGPWCEEGVRGATPDRCSFIGYCHLPGCRSRTRRACRRLAGGCSRASQRLPNNYLFAHAL